MSNIRCILFDCMETLVDLTELPALSDYARWAFDDSGVEHLWDGFEAFFSGYEKTIRILRDQMPQHGEYDMKERLAWTVRLNLPQSGEAEVGAIADQLNATYWNAYKSRCYVKEDVRETLTCLGNTRLLGVVSNFMVPDGIEELLDSNGILLSFTFVVTSIREGWRKPHDIIYRAALQRSGIPPEETVFIGDDYINDYIAPRKLGFHTILLDRYGRHGEVKERMTDFYQLEGILNTL
jgi:putative hydrolase of the HAD superfamily